MGFSNAQLKKLCTPPNNEQIKSRQRDNQTFYYLEGWQVIEQCNRIFGFDSWNRETIALNCLSARPKGDRFCVSYLARVRVTVHAGAQTIIREGSGVMHAIATTLGHAHEIAAKGAETDASKRALATFGMPFGLRLYAGEGDPDRRHSIAQEMTSTRRSGHATD